MKLHAGYLYPEADMYDMPVADIASESVLRGPGLVDRRETLSDEGTYVVLGRASVNSGRCNQFRDLKQAVDLCAAR